MNKVYAIVKNSVVINTILFDNPSEELINHFKEINDADFIMDVDGDIYCAVGGTWDGSKFILPKPYPSWEYEDESRQWYAPIPYPIEVDSEGKFKKYFWNEDILNWSEID